MVHKSFVVRALVAAGVSAFTASTAAAAGNAANGATIFARCAICHNNTKGAGAKIGPDLFGVVGRKAGSSPGFSYSAAMKNSNITWTNDKLDAYIKSPQLIVPGNKMPFSGLPSSNQRADLIAYLDTLK